MNRYAVEYRVADVVYCQRDSILRLAYAVRVRARVCVCVCACVCIYIGITSAESGNIGESSRLTGLLAGGSEVGYYGVRVNRSARRSPTNLEPMSPPDS